MLKKAVKYQKYKLDADFCNYEYLAYKSPEANLIKAVIYLNILDAIKYLMQGGKINALNREKSITYMMSEDFVELCDSVGLCHKKMRSILEFTDKKTLRKRLRIIKKLYRVVKNEI